MGRFMSKSMRNQIPTSYRLIPTYRAYRNSFIYHYMIPKDKAYSSHSNLLSYLSLEKQEQMIVKEVLNSVVYDSNSNNLSIYTKYIRDLYILAFFLSKINIYKYQYIHERTKE